MNGSKKMGGNFKPVPRGDWLPCSGSVEINNGVRIVTDIDFCKYYKYLVEQAFYKTIKYQLPAYLAHITIINPKIHGPQIYAPIMDLEGKRIDFEYNNDLFVSRVNVWAFVRCKWADKLKNKLRIPVSDRDWGLHLTIGNLKYEHK